MKTPKFWSNKNSIVSILLIPLSFLWQLASILNTKKKHKFLIPIIKIGNVVAGGAGKTPTVISLTQKLINSSIKVHIILKGYKSTAKNSIQVNTTIHTYKEVGDEALICAKFAPTWVGKNRAISIKGAIDAGAELVILDDGLQDPSIIANLNILVFNGYQGIGNGRIIPSGPMRENLSQAINRSHLAIIIDQDIRNIKALIDGKIPVLNANIKIEDKYFNNFKNKKVIAFCGIGYPEKFYKTLENIGCQITYTKSFPDHYVYSRKDIQNLLKKSQELNSLLITTEKDHIKIMEDYKNRIYFFPISIEFNDYKTLDNFLLSVIKN